MATGKEVIRAGVPRIARQHPVYEKITDDVEYTRARLYSKGTADKQHKLYNTLGSVALGVFDRNLSQPAYVAGSEIHDSDYSYEGRTVETNEINDVFIWRGTLLDGETVVKGSVVSASVAAGHEGKIITKLATNAVVGVAMESIAASGSDEPIEILFLGPLGALAPVRITEELTGAVESVTCSHPPISISMIDMTAGQTTGQFILAVTAASGTSVSLSGSVLLFHIDDTPTTVSVTYSYLPGT